MSEPEECKNGCGTLKKAVAETCNATVRYCPACGWTWLRTKAVAEPDCPITVRWTSTLSSKGDS